MKKKNIDTDANTLAKEAERMSSSMYDFEVLLDNSKNLDDKKRMLWKQIYRYAVEDRSTANTLFTGAYSTMGQASTDHLAMGSTLAKYLEKMSKSNQQLIELSALMTKDEEQNAKINPDDLFQQIEDKDE